MSGRVHLVGAGPGDPGLMTVRALELIAAADVILHDRLIPDAALAAARPDADLVDVGKQPGAPARSQEEIHRLLVEHARAGRMVVRLKGGDPFVFGRGGEEAEALRAAEAGGALAVDEMVPAPGQGALAVEAREDDAAAAGAVAVIDDPASHARLRAAEAAAA